MECHKFFLFIFFACLDVGGVYVCHPSILGIYRFYKTNIFRINIPSPNDLCFWRSTPQNMAFSKQNKTRVIWVLRIYIYTYTFGSRWFVWIRCIGISQQNSLGKLLVPETWKTHLIFQFFHFWVSFSMLLLGVVSWWNPILCRLIYLI